MLIGYGRVSTSEQNPDHQTDALHRAGVAVEDIYLDTASGAKASRPKLDLVLTLVRDGDQLVITRLDRLGRSVLHLVTLGAQLRDRGVGLRVLDQGIDTATAEGRAMFGMLSVLAELQRELILANTRDGLAAARARGRVGGRRPTLTLDQIQQAQRMYDEGQHTVQQIADILNVKRGTLYGHLNKTSIGTRPRAAAAAHPTAAPPQSTTASDATTPAATHAAPRPVRARVVPADEPAPDGHDLPDRLARQRACMNAARCPSCGNEPLEARDRWQQRQDLAITWLYADPDQPGQVIDRRHCHQCQPHIQIRDIICPLCADGLMLAGDLANPNDALPEPVHQWLSQHGWHDQPDIGPICAQHPTEMQ